MVQLVSITFPLPYRLFHHLHLRSTSQLHYTSNQLLLLHRNCLLDTLSQDKLDGVDVIVFDPSATLRVRQEALAFVMDHTEGFDEDAQADGLEGALDLLDLDQGMLFARHIFFFVLFSMMYFTSPTLVSRECKFCKTLT